MYEIFDFANQNTASFDDLFQSVYDQLQDRYDDEEFEESVHELGSAASDCSDEEVPPSEDSANDALFNEMENFTKHHIFGSQEDLMSRHEFSVNTGNTPFDNKYNEEYYRK